MSKDKIIFKNLITGSFFASFSAALGGSTFVFTWLVVDDLDAFIFNFLRYGLTGLILFLLSISIFLKKNFKRVQNSPSIFGISDDNNFP